MYKPRFSILSSRVTQQQPRFSTTKTTTHEILLTTRETTTYESKLGSKMSTQASSQVALTLPITPKFLDAFPPEIRNKIYRYVLESSTGYIHLHSRWRKLTFKDRYDVVEYDLFNFKASERLSLCLLLTCQQIHAGTRDLLWKLNTVLLGFDDDKRSFQNSLLIQHQNEFERSSLCGHERTNTWDTCLTRSESGPQMGNCKKVSLSSQKPLQ